ncbi:hypothetical protein SCHPADRAFT_943929 [Schizopora paradoxa]|uniref:Uncharacterized protein n=1 Tax=Schizopora paradoxa TaxID=27342 RepID=A0A0H2RWA1_9AGAM|nr:hypothetical protein SCHPADRAFT_943929 [Schizopora paradoxa]
MAGRASRPVTAPTRVRGRVTKGSNTESRTRNPGTVAERELESERNNDPLAFWKNAAVWEPRSTRYPGLEFWAKEKVQARTATAKNGSSRERRSTASAGQTRDNSAVDIFDRDGGRLSVSQRKRHPPQSEISLNSDRTRQSKRPRIEIHDDSVKEGPLLKDSRVELLLEQWLWGDMRFTDASIPNLCFYVRVCTKTSRLESLEKFGESTKVLRALCFAHLRNYALQVSFKHLGGDQSEAYVHLKPMNGVGDSITLKFSKGRNVQDYDSLLTMIRSALGAFERQGGSALIIRP